MKTYLLLFLVLICSCLCSCSEPARKIESDPYSPLLKLKDSDYPDFRDNHDKESLMRSLQQSMAYYKRISPSTSFQFGRDDYDAAHMRQSLEHFISFLEIDPSREQINEFLKKHYAVYTTVKKEVLQEETAEEKQKQSSSRKNNVDLKNSASVLFTGYYEPSIEGSRVKDDAYRYPAYSRPNDLITIRLGLFSSKYKDAPPLCGRQNNRNQMVPYYTRAEINAMEDYEKIAEPVVWLKSRIDRFFLEIQGSGRVELREGGIMRVQYNSKNGRPYRAIGRYLIEKGEIPKKDISMQSIRRWLELNPNRMDEVLHYNPGVVFFQEGKGGPYGCLGVEVTPMRSIATDVSIFPKGALCFIETTIPSPENSDKSTHDSMEQSALQWEKYTGFVLNQDTGGAIRGPGRADLFCGNGVYAEHVAGHMKQTGRLYFLVMKKVNAGQQ